MININAKNSSTAFYTNMDITKIKPIHAIIFYIIINIIIYFKLSNDNKTKDIKDQSTTFQIIKQSIIQSILSFVVITIILVVLKYLKDHNIITTSSNFSSPSLSSQSSIMSNSSMSVNAKLPTIINPLASIKSSINYYTGMTISIILLLCSLLALKNSRTDIFCALLISGIVGIVFSKHNYTVDNQNAKISLI